MYAILLSRHGDLRGQCGATVTEVRRLGKTARIS